MTDAELLATYRESRSPDAFGAIVERHTGMVYSACWRVLRNDDAAQDATQATFLVLVRRAGDLPTGTVLAGWLYLTAHNSARRILRTGLRRVRRERAAGAPAMTRRSKLRTRLKVWQGTTRPSLTTGRCFT